MRTPMILNLLVCLIHAGETQSEGGFAPNRVSAASLLFAGAEKDKKGKTYYRVDVLTRTGEHTAWIILDLCRFHQGCRAWLCSSGGEG